MISIFFPHREAGAGETARPCRMSLKLYFNLFHQEGLDHIARPTKAKLLWEPFHFTCSGRSESGLKQCFAPRNACTRLRAPRFAGSQWATARSLWQDTRRSDFNLFHQEGLDHVAHFDVLELLEGDAALVALGDLLHAVLEALEGGDGAVVDDDVVPQQAHLGAPLDLALGDVAACHHAHAGDAEDVAHLGP